MLTLEQAQNLAAWVCTHDDGTPQPRAEEFGMASGVYGVRIRSLVVNPDGTHKTETDKAYSVHGAREILGY